MAKNATLISIIVPCHNETLNILPMHKALVKTLKKSKYRYEIIFVDDGSSDNTMQVVRAIKSTPDIKVIPMELARNFGKEIAITAGLHAASGDAALMIDADLQHPPQYIGEFLEKWEAGADVVVGVRKENRSYASFVKRTGSKMFYKIINKISETDMVPDATDYRLIDRSVINEFNRFTKRSRMTRGLIDWMGYSRAFVEFEPAGRQHGEASYSFFKLLKLATGSFITMSLVPLKLTGYIGSVITAASGILGVAILVAKYILNTAWGWSITGTASLATLIIFLIGIVMMSLGLIALYIATIHTEVMNRPLYIVRQPRGKARQNGDPLLNVTKEFVREHDIS